MTEETVDRPFEQPRHWGGKSLRLDGGSHVDLSPDVVSKIASEFPKDLRLESYSQLDDLLASTGQWLTPVAEAVRDGLFAGPGLAFLRGDGLDDLTDGQIAALNCAVGTWLGRLVRQNIDGEIVVSVRDKRPQDPMHARGYTTNNLMMFHTDPTEIACLACLHNNAEGGDNLFVSSEHVYAEFLRHEPELVEELFRPWNWYMGGLDTGKSRITRAPVFAVRAGKLNCKYVSYMLRRGAEESGEPLSGRKLAAIDLFDRIAGSEDAILCTRITRGQSAWMNNYKVLHGRSAFSERREDNRLRHLLRLWVNPKHPSPVPDCFTEFDSLLFDHGQPVDAFKAFGFPTI